MGMYPMTQKLLRRILGKPKVKTVLEIGSGFNSTPIIRKYMKSKSGKSLSLEQSQWWVDAVSEKVPNNENGKVIFSPLESDPVYGCRYSYKLDGSEKFDFVLIDGPAGLNKLQKGHLKKYLERTNSPIDMRAKKCTSQSAAILEYVFPAIHKDSIILVDIRIASVLHYYTYKGFNFNTYGKRYVKRGVLRRLSVKKWRPVVKNWKIKNSSTIITIKDYDAARRNFEKFI